MKPANKAFVVSGGLERASCCVLNPELVLVGSTFQRGALFFIRMIENIWSVIYTLVPIIQKGWMSSFYVYNIASNGI